MLKRLNHIAIAVPNLDIAVDNYKKAKYQLIVSIY